uniref:Uncharacterized protein n=1 Tax=Rhizophora mucronata TaxID=61149 RepID=A0A2P2NV46_RHIMU
MLRKNKKKKKNNNSNKVLIPNLIGAGYIILYYQLYFM